MNAAGVMPERSEVYAEALCGHAECDAVRDFVAIRCALCAEPIGFGGAFWQQCGWRLLAHRDCVLAEPDAWRLLAVADELQGEVAR